MENSKEFDQISDLWKKAGAKGLDQKTYSETDINTIKMNKSADFSKSLNTSIVFDAILKGLLILGMLLLLWLYHTNIAISGILVLLIIGSIFFLIKEYAIRKEFKQIDTLSSDVSTVLTNKIKFYASSFPILKLMLAFTNALLVWVGSLFYFYSKYGYYRLDDYVDLLVTVLMLSLAFAISYAAFTIQYKLYIHALKECLTQLSDAQTTSLIIKKQAWRKWVFIIGSILALLLGILLFGYIMAA